MTLETPATDTSYDRIPYRSMAFPQSHPDKLATIGTLLGMNPVPLKNARILELGCASGGNIIPLADTFPEAKFLGLDASSRQIKEGQQVISDLEMQNIELRTQDILEFKPEVNSFDYIICHGVYSWVPPQVQQKILEICQKSLSPQGIGYISYNTYPGWRMRGMIRDIMRYRARHYNDPNQQLDQARRLLMFLTESVRGEGNPYGMFLKSELESISSSDEHYLIHEHLEENNEPVYFHQFAELLNHHQLQYLGEADFGVTRPENLPPNVSTLLQSVSHDVIETEQYMDFLRNRMFRQTLICHADVQLDRNINPQRLHNFFIASDAQEETETQQPPPPGAVRFRRGNALLTTSDRVAIECLRQLQANWPLTIPFQELAAMSLSRTGQRIAAVQKDQMTHQTMGLAKTLIDGYIRSHVELSTIPRNFTLNTQGMLKVSPLVRYQAIKSHQVTSRFHRTVSLDDLLRSLVINLDGTRSQEYLLEYIKNKVIEGDLMLHQDGRRLTQPEDIQRVLAHWLPQGINWLARNGLLIP